MPELCFYKDLDWEVGVGRIRKLCYNNVNVETHLSLF